MDEMPTSTLSGGAEMDLRSQLDALDDTPTMTIAPKSEPDADTDELMRQLRDSGRLDQIKRAEANETDMAPIDATARSQADAHQGMLDEWDKEVTHQQTLLADPSISGQPVEILKANLAFAQKRRDEIRAERDKARALQVDSLSDFWQPFAQAFAPQPSEFKALQQYGESAGADALASGAGGLADYIGQEVDASGWKPLTMSEIGGLSDFGRYMEQTAGSATGTLAHFATIGAATGGSGVIADLMAQGHGQMRQALEQAGVTDKASLAKGTYTYGTLIGGLQAVVPWAVMRGVTAPAQAAFVGTLAQISARVATGSLKMGLAQTLAMSLASVAQTYGITDVTGKPIDWGATARQVLAEIPQNAVTGTLFGAFGEAGKIAGGGYKVRSSDEQVQRFMEMAGIKPGSPQAEEFMAAKAKFDADRAAAAQAALPRLPAPQSGETATGKPTATPEAPAPATDVLRQELGVLATERTPEADARRAEIERQLAEAETQAPAKPVSEEEAAVRADLAKEDAALGEPVLAQAFDKLTDAERQEIAARAKKGESPADLVEEVAIRGVQVEQYLTDNDITLDDAAKRDIASRMIDNRSIEEATSLYAEEEFLRELIAREPGAESTVAGRPAAAGGATGTEAAGGESAATAGPASTPESTPAATGGGANAAGSIASATGSAPAATGESGTAAAAAEPAAGRQSAAAGATLEPGAVRPGGEPVAAVGIGRAGLAAAPAAGGAGGAAPASGQPAAGVAERGAGVTFKTAKGSSYVVHEDGTTSRDKKYRPEHGVKEQGPQPRSQKTVYVSAEDAQKLGEFQTQGTKKAVVLDEKTGHAGVKHLEGKSKGKIEKRTVVKYQTEPAVGLTPVEIWKDGTRVHFGNAITEVVRNAGQPRQIVTPDGSMTASVTPEIVDLATLKLASGKLQPRDRSRAESQINIRSIAANLDPEQMMPGRVSDSGAPIVSSDGTVISGNGRVMALQQVYGDPALKDKADAYKAALGPAAAGMSQPVLISRLPAMEHTELQQFADLSNRSRISAMSATERAMRDASTAGPEIMGLYTGGSFTAPANREFFRAFLARAVQQNEQGAMSRDGMLTKEGDDRLSAAVLASAYGDPSLLARMLESTDDNIRNVTGAMRDAAGAIIRMKETIRSGQASEKFDITPQIIDTAKRIADLRNRGVKPADYLAQQDAFTQIDPITEELLRAFYNDDLSRALSREKLTEVLVRYAEEAEKHSEHGLIPDETSPEDIIRGSRERTLAAERSAASQTDIFAGRPIAAGGSAPGAGREVQGPGTAVGGRQAGATGQPKPAPTQPQLLKAAAWHEPLQSLARAKDDAEKFAAKLSTDARPLVAQIGANVAQIRDRVRSNDIAGAEQLLRQTMDIAARATAADSRANIVTQWVRQAANGLPGFEAAAKPAAAITDAQREHFRETLRGNAPRKQWASELGASPAEMDALIKDAEAQGFLRVDRNGIVRRTAKARTDEPTPEEMLAINAYHASPHAFDRFSMDKIGTGEGAQSFGHGLYFAENQKVMQRYFEDFASRAVDSQGITKEMLPDLYKADPTIAALIYREAFSDVDAKEVARTIQMRIRDARDADNTFGKGGPNHKRIAETVEAVRKSGKAHAYQVSLDVEHHQLLDWDKPLSEQPKEIREKIVGILPAPPEIGGWELRSSGAHVLMSKGNTTHALAEIHQMDNGKWWVGSDTLAKEFETESAAKKAVEKYIDKTIQNREKVTSGEAVLGYLESAFGSREGASNALREAGIPGIRYLDQGSRGAEPIVTYKGSASYPTEEINQAAGLMRTYGSADKAIVSIDRAGWQGSDADHMRSLLKSGDFAITEPKGTHNIVIFDDKLVKITHKNGEPVTAKERSDALEQMHGEQDAKQMLAQRGADVPVTQTAAFKRWFGDSKVVDENGKPIVVYHGTARGGFSEFDVYGGKYGLMGQGGYFTENPRVASEYTEKGIVKMRRAGQEAQTVYPVYLRIENPIDMEAKADPETWAKAFDEYIYPRDIEDMTNEEAYRTVEEILADDHIPSADGAEIMQEGLRAMGHDGITHIGGGRVDPDGVRHRVWVAFDPTQIKSAIGNRGTFDPNNPDITFALRGTQALNATQPRTPTEVKAFHGTGAEMERFDPNFFGQRTQFREPGEKPNRTTEKAFFFGAEPALANNYAENRTNVPYELRAEAIKSGFAEGDDPTAFDSLKRYNPKIVEEKMNRLEEEYFQSGARVFPVFIETKNFKPVDMKGYRWNSDEGNKIRSQINKAKKEGFSGLIIDGMEDAGGSTSRQYAVWDKGNVRSALSENMLFARSDNEGRNHAIRELSAGRAVNVEPGIVTQNALIAHPIARRLPADIDFGILSRIKPPAKGEKYYRGTFTRTDGSTFDAPLSDQVINQGRALFSPSRNFIGSLRFGTLGVASIDQAIKTLGGEVHHEAVHAIWRRLPPSVRSALASHADTIGVLDVQMRDYLTLIGDPSWKSAKPDEPIREGYLELYKGRGDIEDLLAQESVAHMVELYSHGFVSDELAGPVKGLLDAIISDPAALVEHAAGKGGAKALLAQRGADVPVTQTPAFKRWFGDSKVVDENGKPLVVYHGTKADFSVFDKAKQKVSNSFFFSRSPAIPSAYAQEAGGRGGNVMPAYLRIERPAPDYAAYARDDGTLYDGLEEAGIYQVRDPKQIKSAIGNRGTFDPNNPDITFAARAKGDEQRDMFAPRITETFADIRAELGLKLPEGPKKGKPPSLRTQIVAIASEGGRQLLQIYRDSLMPVVAKHRGAIEEMALPLSTDRIGDGFSRFFREFVLRPNDLRARQRALYDDFSDFLDAEAPQLLESIDEMHRLGRERLMERRAAVDGIPGTGAPGGAGGGKVPPAGGAGAASAGGTPPGGVPYVPGFAKGAVKPFADAFHQFADAWKRNFQPELISLKALEADPLFASYRAAAAQLKDAIVKRGEELHAYWRKLPERQRLDFIRDLELGADQPTEGLAEIAWRYRQLLDEAHKLEAVYGSKAGYVEDYFPHIWKDAAKAREIFKAMSAAKNLGPKWFEKERFYDLIEEGLKAGLELKSTNPEELIAMRLMAGADMRMRMELLQQLKKMGLARETKGADNTGFATAGWQAINAPNMEQWLISPDIVPLWENAVEAKGLWTNEKLPGSIFRGWMAFKSAWVPIKLTASMFHPLHVLHINMANDFARAWVQLTRAGDVRGAAASFLDAFTPTQGIGYDARHAWMKADAERTPFERAIVQLMIDGGFKPQMDEMLKNKAKQALQNAIQEGKWLKAAPLGAFRLLQKLMMQDRIFEHWIPGVKAAAYLKEAHALLERRPDLLDDNIQRRVALRAIAKSVDNRFGEMNYSALFWNRTVKDMGIASFLSLGWNLGFVREFGGGITQPIARRFTPSSKPRDTIRASTNKTAFVIAYVSSAALINGIMNYLFSGEMPKDYDYIFPRIGGLNPDGSPRRITNMFYTREVPMLTKHIEEQGGWNPGGVLFGTAEMLYNKMMFQPFVEMAENRDYWGYEIWDTNAPLYKQVEQFAWHILKDQLTPMTSSGAQRARDIGGSWLDKGVPLSFLGFGPAPAYVERTPLENRIRYLYAKFVAPIKKPYEREAVDDVKREAKQELKLALQRGDQQAAAEARKKAREAGVKSGSLTQRKLNVPSSAYLFSRLAITAPEVARSLLQNASPEEVQLYRKYAPAKLRREFPAQVTLGQGAPAGSQAVH